MSTSSNLSTPSTSKKKKEKRANGQGSIYPKKGTHKYIVAVHDVLPNGEIKRRRVTVNSMKAAEAFLYEFRRAQGMGGTTFAVNPKMRVGEFMDKWLESISKEPETMRSYRTAINQWIKPGLGNVLVSGLKPRMIENHYQELAKTKSNSVLNIVHSALSKAFHQGVRLGEIPNNPMLLVEKLKKTTNTRPPIPRADAMRIYAEASKNPYDHARVELGMITPLRPGEAMGLMWKDIDWDLKILVCDRQVQEQTGNGLVFKPRKNKKALVLPLSDAQIEILRVHQLTQYAAKVFWKRDEGLIFPNSVGGKKSPKADSRDWKRLINLSGVKEHYVRYQMKHTGVTHMVTHGVDEKTTATFAGHTSSTVTMKHYASATSESMKNATVIQDSFRPSVEEIAGILLSREQELAFENLEQGANR